jgi:hypothetical protein
MAFTKGKLFRYVWFSVVILFHLWMINAYQAAGVDETITQSSALLNVDITDNYTAFTPTQSKSNQQLIFFPGALVDPVAYYPLLRSIAQEGYAVKLIKMPFRLAKYGYQEVKNSVAFQDSTQQYILCGHSQGGKMAAQFAYENPGLLAGLILLGTSHPRDINLSSSKLATLKISASNDGLASVEEVEQNKPKLPASTRYVLIRGGNHAQFGYYGFQFMDGVANITREQQQTAIKSAILGFLVELRSNLPHRMLLRT